MRLKKTIKHSIDHVKVPMHLTSGSLYIKTALSKCQYLHIYIYNPDHVFIGEIVHGPYGISEDLLVGNSEVTLNGLRHDLIDGLYTFEVMVMDKLGLEIEAFDLEITFTSDEYNLEHIIKDIDDNRLQSESWFRPGYRSRIINDEHRYYRGDLHGHTNYSDGHQNTQEANRTLKDQRLDYMAMTEHNRTAFGYRRAYSLQVPSFELTLPSGHFNIHGIENNRLINIESLDSLVPSEIIRGVFKDHPKSNISLNHMFLDEWAFNERHILASDINTIEVICDPTYPTSEAANQKTEKFLDFLWNKGYKIYGIGGSDSHNKVDDFYEGAKNPSIYGDPATYVFCEGLSVDHLISGLKSGHLYVSRFEELLIQSGDYLPGDEIAEDFIYEIQVKHLLKTYTGRFILNGQVVKEETISPDNKAISINTSLMKENDWLRFSLYDGDKLVAYVNPIYKGIRINKQVVIKELIEEFLNDKRYII